MNYHDYHLRGYSISDFGQIPEWDRLQSVADWPNSVEKYKTKLEEDGLSAWRIESAIGFHGFVIGKEATQKAASGRQE